MIFLGDTVRDQVTGYQGVATARTELLGGRTKILIERPNCDNGVPEECWFDEPRLEVVQPPPTAPIGFHA